MKTILITGASSTLGLEILKHLKKKKLILHYNKKKIKKKNNQNLIRCDFSNNRSTNIFIKKISKMNIDCIIHLPSSKVTIKRFYEYDWHEINQQINIQIRSLHKILINLIKNRRLLKRLLLIIVNSEVIKNIRPVMFDYFLAKSLLECYIKYVKKEFKAIKTYEIFPKMFNSPLLDNIPKFIKEKNINKNKNIKKTVAKIISDILGNKIQRRKIYI